MIFRCMIHTELYSFFLQIGTQNTTKSATMKDFEQFDDVFDFDPNYAYKEQTINQIIRYRRAMEDELFIDRLLKTLGIKQCQLLGYTIHSSH